MRLYKNHRTHAFACALLSVCATQGIGAEYHVSVTGSDANDGSKSAPLKTISAAAAKAQPGDTITVQEGVYRERINPPRGGTSDDKRITYQAAPGAKVVIKGSEQITGWTPVEKDVWKVTLPNSFFGDFNPYSDLLHGDWYEAKRPFHTGAVYLNGHWLKEAPRKSLVVESAHGGMAEDARPEIMNVRQLISGGKNGKNLMAAEFISATGSDGVEVINLPDGLTCVGRLRDGATLTYEMDVGEEARHLATPGISQPAMGCWLITPKSTRHPKIPQLFWPIGHFFDGLGRAVQVLRRLRVLAQAMPAPASRATAVAQVSGSGTGPIS